MAINRKKIEKFLKNQISIRVFEEIDSTNNEAKRRASEASLSPALYVTDCQTAGRGRRGHDFYSPKGSGLYFSLALPVGGQPTSIQLLTCASAVAVCGAIRALSGKNAQVKWVNDIFIDGKKVAGILAELVLDSQNKPLSVIIGIGINLTTAHFPAEFAATAGSVGNIEPNRLCAEICNRLFDLYTALNSSTEAVSRMIDEYSKLNFVLGREITYTDRDGTHTAKAAAIAPDGSLIISENGESKALHSGEISVNPVKKSDFT